MAKCLASRFAHGQCARSRGMPANKKKMARDVRVQHAEGMFINELTARDTHVEKVHEANALINQGHDLLDAGDATGALRIFERVRAKGVTFHDANHALRVERIATGALANAHYALQNYEQCVVEHDRSNKLAADRGIQLSEQEVANLDQALMAASQELEQRADATLARGDVEQALAMYAKAIAHGRRVSNEIVRHQLVKQATMKSVSARTASKASTESTAPSTSANDIEAMSLAQLRQIIEEAGLTTRGCIEKSDMRERAREALAVLRDRET